jgi:hypothetical protein
MTGPCHGDGTVCPLKQLGGPSDKIIKALHKAPNLAVKR